jgi:putative pre-16S rRNA nuclease
MVGARAGVKPVNSKTSSSRVAAIDFGKARVGIAVSDELGAMAHPRPALNGKNRRALLDALAAMVTDEGITRFVVGYPLSMSGEQGVAAKRVARFCQQLATVTRVEVELVDERLTSVQAERELAASGTKRRDMQKKVDGVAAAIILQCWLDQRREDGA